MQKLRNAHFIARLVLVWFALSIGVAIASPMVKPQSLQLICSGSGTIKIISSDVDGKASTTPATSTHTLDCPLCAAMAAPPPVDANHLAYAAPLRYTLTPRAAASPDTFFAAPPPARGPPDSL